MQGPGTAPASPDPPRQDIRVRPFFSDIKLLARYNLNAEQALEYCAAAFGIGQRHVREIVAEVSGGNLVDKQFKALRTMTLNLH